MVMISNRTIMAAVFTIAIVSSLVAVSSFVGSSAFAAKKQGEYGIAPSVALAKEKPISTTKSKNTNANQSPVLALGSPDTVSAKQLRSLSKCENTAGIDGDLTLADVKACYNKVF